METFYEVMRRQGITRRSFLKFCSLTATALGLGPSAVPRIVHAMETKPRTPVSGAIGVPLRVGESVSIVGLPGVQCVR